MDDKNLTNASAIIFDRDGVIIDTDTLVLKSVFFGLKQLGINASKEDIPIMAGMSIDALKAHLVSKGTVLILKKIGIYDMFKVIVSKEDCTKFKPDPEPYILTANKLGILPSECIVFEDSEIGIKAAKSANMYCIAIPSKYTARQDLSLADKTINSIKDIEKMFI